MRTLTALVLASFLVVAVTGVADAKTPITKLVQKDSVAVIGFADLATTKKQIKTTNIYKLFSETELEQLVQAIRSSVQPQLDKAEAQVKEMTGLDFKGICDLLDGELALAVVEADPSKGQPRILVSFGYDRAKHGASVDKLLGLLAKMMGVEKPAERKVGTATITTLAGRGGPPISYTKIDGALLLAIDETTLEQAIGFAAADGKGTLVENERFGAAMKALGVKDPADVNGGVFIDLVPIWKTVDANVKEPKVLKALEVFGLRDWQSMSFINQVRGGQLVDTMHLATNGKSRGLTRWMAPAPVVEGGHLDRVPKKAIAYQTSRNAMGEMYTELLAGVKAVDEEAHGKLTEMIASFEEKLGVKIGAFLNSIGAHMVGHSTMPDAGMFPRGISEIQLADSKAFLAGVEAIGKAMDLKLVSLPYKGKTIYHLQAPIGQLGTNPFEGMDRMNSDPMAMMKFVAMFMPSHFYIDGGWAVFGSLHQHLLDHIDLPAEAKGHTATLPEGTCAMLVSNTAPIMVGIYQSMLPFAGAFEGMMRNFGINFDARLLPRPGTLMKYLSASSMWHMQRAANGITFRFQDNVGLSPAMGIGAMVGFTSAIFVSRGGAPMPPGVGPGAERVPVEETGTKRVGQMAPDFTLSNVKGEKVTLSKLRGKIVVIDFWATWCGPCKQVMPHIQKLHKKYADKGVVFQGINVWDASDKAKAYMKAQAYTYGLLLAGDKVADAYGVTGIPSLFIIGHDGKIVHVKVGYDLKAEAQLTKAIEMALARKK